MPLPGRRGAKIIYMKAEVTLQDVASLITAQGDAIMGVLNDQLGGFNGQLTGFRAEINEFRQEMAEFRQDIRQEMTEFRQEMRQEMADFKMELRSDLASFRMEVIPRLDNLENEVQAMHSDLGEIYDRLGDIERDIKRRDGGDLGWSLS